MKIPVNRHYCTLVTENVGLDATCQIKTAGRGEGVYVLVIGVGGRWTTLQTKQGEVCVVFGGIDARFFHRTLAFD